MLPALALLVASASPVRAEPPTTATAPLPLAGPDVLPLHAGQPETLYINFDGAVLRRGCGNDSRHDCSTLADLFNGYVGPFVGTETRRVGIVQAVRKDIAEFGIRATTRRPEGDDADYTMVLYGDLGAQDFAGIAPYIDCGNLWPNDTCFAGAFEGANTGATIILQEAAHTWGLEHVDSEFDNLHPFVAQATPYFQDQCNKIVANTDLEPVGGVCNMVHELFCETGFQNSHQELLYLFGPALPDTVAPTLELTSPEEGSVHVLPVELLLYGEAVDDVAPQNYTIRVEQDGNQLIEVEDYRVQLRLRNPPPGEYKLDVTVVDPGGNAGRDSVRFTILPEGSEDPDTDSAGSDSETDATGSTDAGSSDSTDSGGETGSDGGACRVQTRHDVNLAALLLLLALPRRRR